jgi:copper transport protein
MDMTVASALQPGTYLVTYRSVSVGDGHILRGSFLFNMARPDGTVPTSNGISMPKQDPLGGGVSTTGPGTTSGQPTSSALFNLIMISIAELAAIFWVGAYVWCTFVHPRAHGGHDAIDLRAQRRFMRSFSLPLLLALFLATIGILAGQGMSIVGSNWLMAFSPSLLWKLVTSSRYGTFWQMREIVIMLTMGIALFQRFSARPAHVVERLLPPLNVVLGGALFVAVSMSSHAAAVNANRLVFAVLVDVLHLCAAAFWVGGMLFIATMYLPVLKRNNVVEQTRSLMAILPAYSPWAIVGVILMAVTGPFSAILHLNSWQQLFTTAYGLALTLKIALVCAMLLISATHVLLLRPRVQREWKKYTHVSARQQTQYAMQISGGVWHDEAHFVEQGARFEARAAMGLQKSERESPRVSTGG